MECLLPFSSPCTSLPSSELLSDIQTMLRLELHSAHTEHIFHVRTDTSDMGATAPTGAGESKGRGGTDLLSSDSGTDRKMSSCKHLPRRLFQQDSEYCLGTCDPVQACHIGPRQAKAPTYSWGLLPGTFLKMVLDPGLAKGLVSTLTARKSCHLLFFIIQMPKNGLAV